MTKTFTYTTSKMNNNCTGATSFASASYCAEKNTFDALHTINLVCFFVLLLVCLVNAIISLALILCLIIIGILLIGQLTTPLKAQTSIVS